MAEGGETDKRGNLWVEIKKV